MAFQIITRGLTLIKAWNFYASRLIIIQLNNMSYYRYNNMTFFRKFWRCINEVHDRMVLIESKNNSYQINLSWVFVFICAVFLFSLKIITKWVLRRVSLEFTWIFNSHSMSKDCLAISYLRGLVSHSNIKQRPNTKNILVDRYIWEYPKMTTT